MMKKSLYLLLCICVTLSSTLALDLTGGGAEGNEPNGRSDVWDSLYGTAGLPNSANDDADDYDLLAESLLARINHKLRSEMQREVLGYKAGTGFRCELYEYIL